MYLIATTALQFYADLGIRANFFNILVVALENLDFPQKCLPIVVGTSMLAIIQINVANLLDTVPIQVGR